MSVCHLDTDGTTHQGDDPVVDIQRCPSGHQNLPSIHLGCTVGLSIVALPKQRGAIAPLAALRAWIPRRPLFGETKQQGASEVSRIGCERPVGQFARSPERQHPAKSEGKLPRQAT